MHDKRNLREVIYRFIAHYIATHQQSPTVREIAAGCEVALSTVVHHLNGLEAEGRVYREWYKKRSLRLHGPAAHSPAMTERVFEVIAVALQQEGLAPTQREIARRCHLSKRAVHLHLTRLERAGRIVRGPGHRDLRLAG